MVRNEQKCVVHEFRTPSKRLNQTRSIDNENIDSCNQQCQDADSIVSSSPSKVLKCTVLPITPSSKQKSSKNFYESTNKTPVTPFQLLDLSPKTTQSAPSGKNRCSQTRNSIRKPRLNFDDDCFVTALSSAETPTLVCRENEINAISNLIKNAISDQKSMSAYVCGPPGTGKTACLKHILSLLKNNVKFIDVYVNCMEIHSAFQFYNLILSNILKMGKCAEDLSSNNISIQDVNKKISCAVLKSGCGSKKQMILLILDEIDQLRCKNQDILYNVFQWPVLKDSRLMLIGVANSFDLTDRWLPKLTYKPVTFHFKPYSANEIEMILKSRLNEISNEFIQPSAIELCARKISAVTGDVRRALDLARMTINQNKLKMTTDLNTLSTSSSTSDDDSSSTASDIVRPSPEKLSLITTAATPVKVADVLNALNHSAFGSQRIGGGKTTHLPLQQRLVLACILRLRLKNKAPPSVSCIYRLYKALCARVKIEPFHDCFNLCELLDAQGYLEMLTLRSEKYVKLLLEESYVRRLLDDQSLLDHVFDLKC